MTANVRHFLLFFLMALVFPALSANAKPNNKYASFVMDADTGLILHERHADKVLHPASLTKMMTMMMAFEYMDRKKLSANTRVRMSRHAASMVPSKLNIPAGGSIRVKDALFALATKSANDVAVALAEHIGGTESNFAKMMTTRARAIGMSRTTFRNASGLHDKRQVSTARDMAKLARYILIRYPHYYKYFSTKQFTYRGHTYRNHNKLLGTYNGVDGFKTGYINASGFNLVASAKRNQGRIIGVVFGGKSGKTRNAHMVELLDKGFGRLNTVRIAAARNMPKPQRKPLQATGSQLVASAAQNETSFTSLSSLGQTSQNRPARLKSMDIGAFSELIGQGDYDPEVSKRLETGLLAVAVHKGEYTPDQPAISNTQLVQRQRAAQQPVQKVAYTPTGRWAIQIGAFSSRAHADFSLRQAIGKLPNTLNRGRAQVVPLRTASGLLYRGRISGYSKSEAIAACNIFPDCLTIAP